MLDITKVKQVYISTKGRGCMCGCMGTHLSRDEMSLDEPEATKEAATFEYIVSMINALVAKSKLGTKAVLEIDVKPDYWYASEGKKVFCAWLIKD